VPVAPVAVGHCGRRCSGGNEAESSRADQAGAARGRTSARRRRATTRRRAALRAARAPAAGVVGDGASTAATRCGARWCAAGVFTQLATFLIGAATSSRDVARAARSTCARHFFKFPRWQELMIADGLLAALAETCSPPAHAGEAGAASSASSCWPASTCAAPVDADRLRRGAGGGAGHSRRELAAEDALAGVRVPL
jgi:hypothetical protein